MAMINVIVVALVVCLTVAQAAPQTRAKRQWLEFCRRHDPMELKDMRPALTVSTRECDWCWTSLMSDDGEVAEYVQKLEGEKYIRTNRPVIILVHGYMGAGVENWQADMTKVILKAEDATVIQVSWFKGSESLNFGVSASNTQTVSSMISTLATTLLKSSVFENNIQALYLHCIGHSLGAHICGQAGRKAKIFDRVTGLDPAGPGFEKCTDNWNINKDSAVCVDNIHTDGTADGHPLNPVVPYFGTMSAWGHIDFYPNNGTYQPGCGLNPSPSCSHSRATSLFIDTIKTGKGKCIAKDLAGTQQQSLGYYSSCYGSEKTIPGQFYLKTKSAETFCMD